MNILMVTNTYKPIMGGLEKSVEQFTKNYRKRGHRVIIVAPVFENAPDEADVIRVPAMQNFNGTDFSVQLPVPGVLTEKLGDFKPDIVHSHHPFLLGDTALRLAHKHNVPLVFTHHTLYEQNTHYVPGDSEALKRFVIELSVGYCNLADQVFCPSESILKLLQERGVTTHMNVVPTGLDPAKFEEGDREKIREKAGIPAKAFVVGHLGRLAPEKNLEFVARSVALFLNKNPKSHFLVVGKGPSEEILKQLFAEAGVGDRLHMTGALSGQALIDAYHAMDVFAFASQSETQGLVLTEAMACGVPVVGVDAPGVRDVVEDKDNGRLLPSENAGDFVEALEWMAERNPEDLEKMRKACLAKAEEFSMTKCVDLALEIYETLIMMKDFVRRPSDDSPWASAVRMIQAHWGVMKNITKATGEALRGPGGDKDSGSVNDSQLNTPLV
jgi:1,2-diacylglycerol 3-alpha-glucosyltransferase